MIDMQTKIETKRQILLMLTKWSSTVSIDKFLEFVEQEYSEALKAELKFEFIKKCMMEMHKDGLIESIVEIHNKEFDAEDSFKLSRRGEEFAENIRNNECWKETMKICSDLNNFTERTVLSTYDHIIQREINKLVNGNPLKDIADALHQIDQTIELKRLNG